MTYLKLTKIEENNKGQNIVVCRFKDTEMCPIHNGGNCTNCVVFNKIIQQLNAFENAFESCVSEVKQNSAN